MFEQQSLFFVQLAGGSRQIGGVAVGVSVGVAAGVEVGVVVDVDVGVAAGVDVGVAVDVAVGVDVGVGVAVGPATLLMITASEYSPASKWFPSNGLVLNPVTPTK